LEEKAFERLVIAGHDVIKSDDVRSVREKIQTNMPPACGWYKGTLGPRQHL